MKSMFATTFPSPTTLHCSYLSLAHHHYQKAEAVIVFNKTQIYLDRHS